MCPGDILNVSGIWLFHIDLGMLFTTLMGNAKEFYVQITGYHWYKYISRPQTRGILTQTVLSSCLKKHVGLHP